MNIQLASDIHAECHRDLGREFFARLVPVAETLVLAGDICSARFVDHPRSIFAATSKKFKNVVYVPGNHEFYLSSLKAGWRNLREAAKNFPNVHVLDNQSVDIDGVHFFGGTGWFPHKPESDKYRPWMNDFNIISDMEDVYASNTNFGYWAAGDVIVSHHLPDARVVSPKYQGDPLNAFFVGDFDLKRPAAKLWLFGHTHDQVDMTLDGVRLRANPLGYPKESHATEAFKDQLVLTI